MTRTLEIMGKVENLTENENFSNRSPVVQAHSGDACGPGNASYDESYEERVLAGDVSGPVRTPRVAQNNRGTVWGSFIFRSKISRILPGSGAGAWEGPLDNPRQSHCVF